MVRNVNNDIVGIETGPEGSPAAFAFRGRMRDAVEGLLRMMRNSASYSDLDAKADQTKTEATQAAVSAIPSAETMAASASSEASKVVSRRVASAVNTAAATVPGLGTADVVLALTPPLLDANYVPITGAPMTNTTTLLGLVSILGVTARTASTMTVRLRNTGASAAVVPAGAITAAAIHPNTA